MLTTEFSPARSKISIGIQAPAMRPMVEEAIAITTPKQTIQLHKIALTKTVSMLAAPKCA